MDANFFHLDLMRSNLLQPAVATGMSNTLSLFQDTVAHLERICNTPLPFAYQAHLRMSLWLVPFAFFISSSIIETSLGYTLPCYLWASSRYSFSFQRLIGRAVPNLYCLQIYHDPCNCIRIFHSSRIFRDRTRDASCRILSFNAKVKKTFYSENPFNYDFNDLGTTLTVTLVLGRFLNFQP